MEEAERLAAIDPLTGVNNRRILEWQIERRMTNASPFFVVYLDLNEFKHINDALGHQAGDDLLMQFAGELRQSLRSTDLVGRLGGDEFVVAIDGVLGDVKDRVAHVKKRREWRLLYLYRYRQAQNLDNGCRWHRCLEDGRYR